LLIAAPFLLCAPFVHSLVPSLLLFCVAELGSFLNAGPLNAALLNACTARTRELAMGMNVLAIHLFGDAISPWLLGFMRDHLVLGGVAAGEARILSVAI